MTRPWKRIAFVTDLHLPYFRRDHFEKLAIPAIRDFRPHAIVDGGDGLDASGISRFGNAPDHDILDEYVGLAEVRRQMREACPRGVECWALEGNHDMRVRLRTEGQVPKYLRRAVHWAQQRGCEELTRWQQKHYRKARSGFLVIGNVAFAHGWRSSNNLDAIEVADILGRSGMLVCLGHTHVPTHGIVQCRASSTAYLNTYYLNAGTWQDPESVEWTARINASHWRAAVALVETNGREFRANVELF